MNSISWGGSNWGEVIAYHGWGYSAADWQGWQIWLGQQRCLLKPFNRGYFGAEVQPQFSASAPAKLIFAHSYGLHFCTAEALRAADLLVIFSSFRQFHSDRVRLKKRSQQIVQHMSAQFEQQPQVVLQNFRTKCLHPAGEPASEFLPGLVNLQLLSEDLKQLDDGLLNLLPLQQLPKIVVLHGAQDRIVPIAMGQALAADLAAPYFEIAAAGHALPFTQAAACQAILRPFLEELVA